MPPKPDITTVAELEPFGLSIDSLEILDKLGFVTMNDMEELTADDIRSYEGGGPVTIQNIRETLQNYRDKRIVRTDEDLMFPKYWPTKTRKKK